MAFEPKPTFRVADRFERMEAAIDMPFSLSRNLGEQFQQGFLDSFGAGTAVRDLSTPRGNVFRQPRAPTGNPLVDTITGVYDLASSAIESTRPDQPSLTKEQYEASPHFREAIPFEPGMTEDRAASLADQWDLKAVRSHFAEKRPFSSFAGQLAGQLFDPINYVPVFGAAAGAAAVARFGSIKGRALLGASDAAINTAAFGVLTSDMRRKFGDDVSFEAIATEVAMSALIGGAFGSGIGFFMRGRDARETLALARARDELTNVRSAQEGRAALNDAVAGLVERGEVRLSPNAITPIERIRAEVTARTTGRRALEAETEAVAGTKAGEVVIAPSGARVAVRPEVVDMATLKKATGALQVRNRDSAASAAQVEDIAINLDAARLMPNVDGSQGAPLVGADNVIDSGNGRVMALERAADAYPARYAEYRKALEDAGYSTEGMERPVLISRRMTELSPEARAQFNADVNQPTTARMSAVELAAMDRAALTDDVLNSLTDAPVSARSNRDFVARFLANLPQNDRGSLLDTAGNLNADGVRRIESTLVAAAYGDIDAGVVRRFAEATDDNTRAIVGAMADVAGKWVQMRRAAQRGKIDPAFDATPELTTALRLLGGWRDQAAREKRAVSNVIREGMAQLDLLTGEISPEAQIFVRMFYQNDHFAVATGRETLAGRLSDVIDTAMTFDLDQPQMFGNEAPGSKMGMLANAIRKYTDEGNLFAAADTLDRPEAVLGARTQPPLGENRSFGRPAISEGGRPATAEQVATAELLKDSQPARSLDELYAVAPAHQEALGALGAELGAKHGAEWRDPGLKSRETAAEKMLRKRYDSTKRLTDVVRGGFVVKAPTDADGIAADLAARFTVFDEGWRMTEAGYFDRKLMVQFEDGTIGEVQFWHPDMLAKKDGEGHKLYEEMRTLPDGDARYLELLARQKALYAETITMADDAWIPVIDQLLDDMAGGRPASGNASSNAASDSLVPESITSSNRTGSQTGASDTMASAVAPSNIAGRPSQSKNFGSMPDGIGGTRGVVDTMARRFADAGRPEDEAAALGTMIGEFYRTAAARIGASVDSLVRRYGLPDVQRGGQMDERMLGQAALDARAPTQAVVDGLEAEAKALTDLLESEALSAQGDGSGVIDPAVLGHVARVVALDDDVVGVIVRSMPVSVMDLFTRQKVAPELALRDEAVLKDVFSVDRAAAVALGVDPSDGVRSFVRLVADAATERADLARRSLELDAAMAASGGDAVSGAHAKSITETPAFLNWFGNSKVVDAEGKPLRVFHGTNAPDIEAFDATRLGEATGAASAKMGFFFASNPKVASSYADTFNAYRDTTLGRMLQKVTGGRYERWNEALAGMVGRSSIMQNANVLPVFINIRNPKEVDFGGAEYRDRTYADIIAEAKTEGHDGVILRNTIDEGFEEGGDVVTDVFVAFDPTQIKSVFNRGTFDPADPRLLFQPGDAAPRGAIRFDDSGRSTIALFEAADASTALHETGHHFLTMFKSMAEGPDAPAAMVDDWIRVQSWWRDNADAVANDSPMEGITAADVHAVIDNGTTGDRVKDMAVNVGLQEQWARAFEAYAREGIAPTDELRGVFAQFKAWLTKLYRSAKDLNVNLSDDIRQAFDNLLTPEPTQRSLDVPRGVDATEPKPDPVPEGLDMAEARLTQTEAMRDLAEAHGVAEDGSFVEQADVDEIREAGRLLPEEEAELEAADLNFANAEAYGRSLKAAMACMLKG